MVSVTVYCQSGFETDRVYRNKWGWGEREREIVETSTCSYGGQEVPRSLQARGPGSWRCCLRAGEGGQPCSSREQIPLPWAFLDHRASRAGQRPLLHWGGGAPPPEGRALPDAPSQSRPQVTPTGGRLSARSS